MQLANGTKNDKGNFQRIAKYGLFVLAGTIIIWLCMRFASLIVAWSLYSRFFQRIREVGGLPNFLSGAIAIWCVVVVILFIPTITFSIIVKRNRKMVLVGAGAFSLWMVFLYGLSVQQSKNLFNPMTGTANYNYIKNDQGEIKLFPRDYSFDPETGQKLDPLDHVIVSTYRQQQQQQVKEAERRELESQKNALQQCESELAHEKSVAKARTQDKQPEKMTILVPPGLASPVPAQEIPVQEQKSLVPINPPAPRPQTQPQPIKRSDFTIKMDWCRRTGGDRLQCRGIVTNTTERRIEVGFDTLGSSAVDNLGNQYPIYGTNFFFGTLDIYRQTSRQTLEPNLGISLAFTLFKVVDNAKKVNVTFQCNEIEENNGFPLKVTLRDVPIE